MFSGVLNKGVRGGLAVTLSFILVLILLSAFSVKVVERNNYPNLFYNYLAAKISSKALILFINYLFIILGGILVNSITINQEITDKNNFFPVFIFVTLSAVSVNAFQITSQAFTNVFTLYSIYKLFDIYRKESVLNQLFEAAFWLSLSAYLTISSIISFPLFFIILLILRPFYWRDWVISILGFLSPILIFESLSYLSNFNNWYFIKSVGLYFKSFTLPSFSEYYLPLTGFLFFFLLLSIINSFLKNSGSTLKMQRAKYILLWILLFSTCGLFSGGSNSSNILLTFAFPVSFFIGDFLFGLKDKKIANTILTVYLLCIALVVIAQYNVI